MGSEVYQSQKCELKYSKSQIEKAARKIRHGCEGAEREEAIKMIQNFRELHLYPLMLMKNHLDRAAKKVDKENKIIVARRLKRLSTIIDKLERPSLDGGATNNA
ncbi:TPA: GTP pyrophosphokinase, partial [Escherichia coli]